ncbi:hypothetical protein [Streptomyces prunicolor]
MPVVLAAPASPAPDADLVRRRAVADALRAAGREGDFDALVKVLAPDVFACSEGAVAAGAAAVATGATSFAHFAARARPALVDHVTGIAYASSSTPTVSPSLSSPFGRNPSPR